jgi:hypothetical protein
MDSRHCENSPFVKQWQTLYTCIELYGPLVWAIAATIDISKWTTESLKPNFIFKKYLSCDLQAIQELILYENKCEPPHLKLGPKNPRYQAITSPTTSKKE